LVIYLYIILKQKKISKKQSRTVKVLEWIDDSRVLLIIGFAFGTVSQGGDLYCYNIDDKTCDIIIEAEKNSEIIDIELEDKELIISKILWLDDNYMDYETIKEEVIINEILP